MADTRIKDLPNDPFPVGGDRMPIDSAGSGTRSIPLSAVGSVLGVPAPAGAAPPAVAAAAATGASTSFAREDHVHVGVTSLDPDTLGAMSGPIALTPAGAVTLTIPSPGEIEIGCEVPAPSAILPAAVAGAGATGIAADYSREDHVHAGVTSVQAEAGAIQGALTLSAGANVAFTTVLNDIQIDVTGFPSPAGVAPPAVAAASAVGASTNYARQDHTHAAPEAATAMPGAVAAAGAVGVATKYAREDHVHAGAVATATTPGAVAATSSVGVATDFARADHVHASALGFSFGYSQVDRCDNGTFTVVFQAGSYKVGRAFFYDSLGAASGKSITGVRFYWPGGLGAKNVKCQLYKADGVTLLATITVAVNAAGIYTATFGAPIPMTMSDAYKIMTVTMWVDDGSGYVSPTLVAIGSVNEFTFEYPTPASPGLWWYGWREAVGDTAPTTAGSYSYAVEPVVG